MALFDIINPAQPKWLITVDLPEHIRSVAIQSDYAYVTTSEQLVVIDISEPLTASIVSSTQLLRPSVFFRLNSNHHLAIKEHYAFITYENGLQIVDISNPLLPVVVAHTDEVPVLDRGLVISGSQAYIADHLGGLLVIDIDAPLSPKVIGHIDTGSHVNAIDVQDKLIFLADDFLGFTIFPAIEPAMINYIDSTQLEVSVPKHLAQGIYHITVLNTGDGLVKKNNALSVLDIATFDLFTGRLTLPVVEVNGTDPYEVSLQQVINAATPFEFILDNTAQASRTILQPSTFSFGHNILHIPKVNVLNKQNHIGVYTADLQLSVDTEPLMFTLINTVELDTE